MSEATGYAYTIDANDARSDGGSPTQMMWVRTEVLSFDKHQKW